MPEPDPIPAIQTPWGPLTPADGAVAGGGEPAPVAVPDHTLLRRIGRGAYGEVWLARNALGLYRAVKVLHRSSFGDDRPFEREFAGIQRFEPVSRTHESQLNILHVGRTADHFYYVMELADDQGHGAAIDEATYTPRSLRSELLFRGRLPVDECLRLGLALTTALGHLHRHGLVHRDIKPSNIVFVNGIPKLADIGLVAQAERTMSFVGTEGYLPPEGPGTVQADLFSLGKVLYEISTGNDRQQFPELPTNVAELPDRAALAEFNEVLVRACAPDVRQRYQTAAEMHADLALLQSGGSVARQRSVQRRLRFLARAGALVTALAVLAGLGFLYQQRQTQEARRLAGENRRLAEEKLTLAEQANASAALARKNEAAARESLYAADINVAHQALQAGNLRFARALLQNHLPQPGQPDVRGFEWRYLWRQCQSPELFSFTAHTNTSRLFALAPDGRRIAVGGLAGTTKILDLQDGRELASLPSTNHILSLSFSRDGRQLAVGTRLDVQVWDARSFAGFQRIPAAGAPAIFSPDGRFLLTGRMTQRGNDQERYEEGQELIVWDTSNWSRLHATNYPASGWDARNVQDHYLYLAFGNDASRVAVLAGDTLRILSCPDLRELQVIPEKIKGGPVFYPFVSLSPDNRRLAFPGRGGADIRLWDLAANRELRVLPGHVDQTFDAAFSPDSTLVATCSPDQTVKLWSVDTGECLQTFHGQADEVFDVEFSSDGRRLYSLGSYDAVVKVWDPQMWARRDTLRRPFVPTGFDGLGGLAGYLLPGFQSVVLDLNSWSVAERQSPVAGAITNHAVHLNELSQDGRLQSLWRRDTAAVEIWDRLQSRLLCSLPTPVPLVSFDAQQNLVATFGTNAAGSQSTTIWQLPEGTARWVFTNAVGFGPNTGLGSSPGHFLTQELEADGSFTVRVRRLNGDVWEQRFELNRREGYAGGALSPDGRLLALTSGDITLLDVASGKVTGILKGHTRKGVDVRFSPDGRTLASMADDRTLRLWHVATQRELLRFQTTNVDQGFLMFEFSPDGRALAASRFDEQGKITSLYFAPSFAELAVADGGDYAKLAGQDPATWMAVAETLRQRGRFEQALRANTNALALVGPRERDLGLDHTLRRVRVTLLRALGRMDEAAADNLAQLGIPARDPTLPVTAVDLSAYYVGPLAWEAFKGEFGSDLRELPAGPRVLAGTLFDVRGHVGFPIGPEWGRWPRRMDGIPIGQKLARLHLLQSTGGWDARIKTGDRIGHYRIRYADGRTVELPLHHNVNTTDWWEHAFDPKELPEATVAWRGFTMHGRAEGPQPIRLFKLTWENPHPDLEVMELDVVAEHSAITPMLIALTAE